MPREVGKAGASDFFNLFVLRRLYNPGNIGRGLAGEHHRGDLHTTITKTTKLAMSRVVPTGQGRYSAPVIELGMRVVLYLVGALPEAKVAEEVALALRDRKTAAARLFKLARAVEAYSGDRIIDPKEVDVAEAV